MSDSSSPGPAGKMLSVLLILVLMTAGVYVLLRKRNAPPEQAQAPVAVASAESTGVEAGAWVESMREVPRLAPPAPAPFQDGVVQVELSDYAGYAGFLLANGGTEPNENSLFFRDHGFKVKVTIAEEDDWSGLNSGKFAASATTTDVLAVYGRQLQVTCPLLLAWSRGADGIVVRSEIRRLNQLVGKVVVAAQFNESDFFLRYLAQEAGVRVNLLSSLSDPPVPDQINVVYAEDAFAAGDLFLQDLSGNTNQLAGCVTWAPKTTDVVRAAGDKARLLTTNRNLLVISDILLVNQGFAKANPKIVAGLVAGTLEGNRRVRSDPATAYAVLKSAFNWDAAESKEELAKVHLANLPENQAYFAGTIDMAGSFGGIYQSAVVAYGKELLPNPAGYEKFMDPAPLQAAAASGKFAGEQISIAPIRSESVGAIEHDPLLSKDIRFLFEPESSTLTPGDPANEASLKDIQRLLRVSPGSVLQLRGHVDNSKYEGFKKQGDAFLRKMSLQAMKLSQDRANEIRKLMVESLKVSPDRIETVGRGWEEPAGTIPEQNRRVEVLWFTLE